MGGGVKFDSDWNNDDDETSIMMKFYFIIHQLDTKIELSVRATRCRIHEYKN